MGNNDKSLYSCINMNNISLFPDEKEVLFLPFSCFEILKVIHFGEKANAEKYIIELTYIGLYKYELKNIENEKKIPETKFRQFLEESL